MDVEDTKIILHHWTYNSSENYLLKTHRIELICNRLINLSVFPMLKHGRWMRIKQVQMIDGPLLIYSSLLTQFSGCELQLVHFEGIQEVSLLILFLLTGLYWLYDDLKKNNTLAYPLYTSCIISINHVYWWGSKSTRKDLFDVMLSLQCLMIGQNIIKHEYWVSCSTTESLTYMCLPHKLN